MEKEIKKELDGVKKILGTVQDLRIGDQIVDLYPIRLNDWPKFSENLGVLRPDKLQEIFRYVDAPGALEILFRLVIRKEETPPLYYEITQKDYKDFRAKVIEQNDLDFDKISVTGGDPKNEGTPSQ